MSFQFKHLFRPFKFRTFEVKNRIVLPPMAIYIPGCEGFVRQKLLDYYEARLPAVWDTSSSTRPGFTPTEALTPIKHPSPTTSTFPD